MKRVIDISEDAYELLLEKGTCGKFANLGEIVANSTPLEQELTKNDLGVEHHKQNIKAYAQDFGVTEEQAEKELRVTTKNNLGVDCISRQAVIDLMIQKWGENFSGDDAMQESIDAIRVMPSVTPQEPVIDRIFDEVSHLVFRPYEGRDTLDRKDVLQIIDNYKADKEQEDE